MNRLGLCAVLSIGAIHCGGPATGLVVVVRSDLRTPEELALVRAVVRDASGKPVSLNDFVLDGPSSKGLPFSFGVVPLDDDPKRMIQLDLVALDGERRALFQRRARTGFVENRSLRLEMFLAGECRTTVCGDGETCTERGCESDRVPPEELSELDPDQEI